MSLLDTPHLAVFLAVCREGTLARAAEALHKTQPAVSYDVRRLEETLGARLFERSGRRLRDLGERYARAFDDYRHQVSGAAAHTPLRAASVSGFGRYVLYPARDVTRARGVPATLLFRTADEVFGLVETGEVDCGAVYHTRISSRLEFAPVYLEELVLIVPASLRLGAAAWSHLRTFSEIPFVTYEEGEYVFGRWFEVCVGRQPPTGTSPFRFTELEEVIDAVSHGCGASIVPRDAVPPDAARLKIVRPRGRRCFNQVFRVGRPGSHPLPVLDDIFALIGRSSPRAGRRRERTVVARD